MRIAIIGGSGQMGRWFAAFFKRKGHSVVINGRDAKKLAKTAKALGVEYAKDPAEAVRGAKLVMISVLPHDLERALKAVAPHLDSHQRVIDVTSVKVHPVSLMHRYIKGPVTLGTHPMFGPSAPARGQNFILTPTNRREREFAAKLGRTLANYGFTVYITTPERHDAAIGYILSLTHFIGFVTADTWKHLKIEKYLHTSSTSFRFLLQFAKSVVDSDPELYSYLQMEVPTTSRAESLFVSKADAWARLMRRKERKKFKSRMSELSAYLDKLRP